MADIISDSYTFGGGVKLQAQYQSSGPVSSGNIPIPLSSSGSWAYYDCNINLGSLTITKIEIKKSSPYKTWRITCTGSGTWTGHINWDSAFASSSTDTFTLSSGTQTKTITNGMQIDGEDALGLGLVTGKIWINTASSIVLDFIASK